ncbi:MAG: hypothetical protein O7J95_06950 [Planctomycetota bacterium]|nr:hypothetical protein [Planctomycetota bacterium]
MVTRRVAIATIVAASLAALGCEGSGEPRTGSDLEALVVPEGVLAVVGGAPFADDLRTVRLAAAADARERLARKIPARLDELAESWARLAGDVERARERLQGLIRELSFRREAVEDAILEARPLRFSPPASRLPEPGETVHCLMAHGEPLAWVAAVDAAFEKSLREDAGLWPSATHRQGFTRRARALRQVHQREATEGRRLLDSPRD